ncbi:RICIN domain-containing protein [Streptomyces sp. NPDC006645]|uniref:RICIN domain-containing protein n=1 Tax=unclassified Streptomyces TaxID=2593676 RepID=UPI0033A827F4
MPTPTPTPAAEPDPEPVPAPAATPTPTVVNAPSPATTAGATHNNRGPVVRSGSDDTPPGARSRKHMLVAASIAGVLLIAVPLLAAGEDEREPDRAGSVAGASPDTETSARPDTDGSKSPTAPAKPDTKEEKAPKSVSMPGNPPAGTSPSTLPSKREVVAEGGTEAKDKPATTPKAAKKKTEAPTPRDLANALSGRVNILLKSAETGKCADLPYFGKGKVNGPVRQYDCRPTTKDNQLWDLRVVDSDGGPGGASLFIIKNRQDGLCVDLPNFGAPAHGTKLAQYHCNSTGADNQRWWLDPHPGGFWIRNATNNRCMAVDGGRAAGNDARLKVTDCNDTAQSAQRWTIASAG